MTEEAVADVCPHENTFEECEYHCNTCDCYVTVCSDCGEEMY